MCNPSGVFSHSAPQKGSAALSKPLKAKPGVEPAAPGWVSGNHSVPPAWCDGAVKSAQHFEGAVFCLV